MVLARRMVRERHAIQKDKTMQHNAGGIDRAVRAIAGLMLLSLVFVGPKTLWGLLGLVPLGICPAYLPFGLKTCKRA